MRLGGVDGEGVMVGGARDDVGRRGGGVASPETAPGVRRPLSSWHEKSAAGGKLHRTQGACTECRVRLAMVSVGPTV